MWANAQHDGRPAEHRWRPLSKPQTLNSMLVLLVFSSRHLHRLSEGSPGLLVHQCQVWWTLAQEDRLGCQNTKGLKKICNTFLVYHLAEHDEIWHRDGH